MIPDVLPLVLIKFPGEVEFPTFSEYVESEAVEGPTIPPL